MEQKPRKLFTLCMIHQDGKILLGMKKKGFGVGRWNGFGGKVEIGEAIDAAAAREVREEAGINPLDIKKVGILEFEFQNDSKVMEVHIFSATKFSGDPVESDEMRPQWFDINKIPFDDMWSDDRYWLPMVIQGKKFTGRFLFDQPSTAEYSAKIIEEKLDEVVDL
ncbi:MAG: 8-oxo-dGTP diphosphatase [Candidatus Pacebacteria bacterium]|nr:8-oxo-dGTP diphosphatase [Candidatus Paceibacterota bacterium]